MYRFKSSSNLLQLWTFKYSIHHNRWRNNWDTRTIQSVSTLQKNNYFVPELYSNKRTIGIATILNELSNNYLNRNAIWNYYNRDKTMICSDCRELKTADMEELRQWILSLWRPEQPLTTRAIKIFFPQNMMTRYCKLVGQK